MLVSPTGPLLGPLPGPPSFLPPLVEGASQSHLTPHTSHPLASCTSSRCPVLASCPSPPELGSVVGPPGGDARPSQAEARTSLSQAPVGFPFQTPVPSQRSRGLGGQGEQEPGLGGRRAGGLRVPTPSPSTPPPEVGPGIEPAAFKFQIWLRGLKAGCLRIKIETRACAWACATSRGAGGGVIRRPEGAC